MNATKPDLAANLVSTYIPINIYRRTDKGNNNLVFPTTRLQIFVTRITLIPYYNPYSRWFTTKTKLHAKLRYWFPYNVGHLDHNHCTRLHSAVMAYYRENWMLFKIPFAGEPVITRWSVITNDALWSRTPAIICACDCCYTAIDKRQMAAPKTV